MLASTQCNHIKWCAVFFLWSVLVYYLITFDFTQADYINVLWFLASLCITVTFIAAIVNSWHRIISMKVLPENIWSSLFLLCIIDHYILGTI